MGVSIFGLKKGPISMEKGHISSLAADKAFDQCQQRCYIRGRAQLAAYCFLSNISPQRELYLPRRSPTLLPAAEEEERQEKKRRW
eukprot:s198_g19.t1